MPVVGPDQWGDFGMLPTGLTVDRFVKAVQVREVSDLSFDDPALANTVGGRFVWHHMNYGVRVLDEDGNVTGQRMSIRHRSSSWFVVGTRSMTSYASTQSRRSMIWSKLPDIMSVSRQ